MSPVTILWLVLFFLRVAIGALYFLSYVATWGGCGVGVGWGPDGSGYVGLDGGWGTGGKREWAVVISWLNGIFKTMHTELEVDGGE